MLDQSIWRNLGCMKNVNSNPTALFISWRAVVYWLSCLLPMSRTRVRSQSVARVFSNDGLTSVLITSYEVIFIYGRKDLSWISHILESSKLNILIHKFCPVYFKCVLHSRLSKVSVFQTYETCPWSWFVGWGIVNARPMY